MELAGPDGTAGTIGTAGTANYKICSWRHYNHITNFNPQLFMINQHSCPQTSESQETKVLANPDYSDIESNLDLYVLRGTPKHIERIYGDYSKFKIAIQCY